MPLMYSAFHGDQIVIPCRVTNPQINATLRKGSSLFNEGNELVYNPMEGFIIAAVTVHFAGQLTCRASMNGQTEEKGILLHYAGIVTFYCLG